MDETAYKDRVAWLRRYQDSLRDIHITKLELEAVRTQAEHITPVLSDAPGGGSGQGNIPQLVERMDSIKQDMAAQIMAGCDIQQQIADVIKQLSDVQQREILHRRYIMGQKWKDLSAEMNLDTSWATRLHRKAVEKLIIPGVR